MVSSNVVPVGTDVGNKPESVGTGPAVGGPTVNGISPDDPPPGSFCGDDAYTLKFPVHLIGRVTTISVDEITCGASGMGSFSPQDGNGSEGAIITALYSLPKLEPCRTA